MEPEKGAATATAEEKGKAPAAGAVGMITLRSSEGTRFEVSVAAARLSTVLADIIEKIVDDDKMRLPNVTAGALALVIKYCEEHAAAAANPGSDHGAAGSSSSAAANNALTSEALKKFDRELVDSIHQDDLYDLVEAAHYLHIEGLIAVASQQAADRIKGKTAAQLRQEFNLPNDITPEEAQAIRDEYEWGFDG